MEKNPWTGRLGVEVTGKMGGCCIESISKWRPQVVGIKKECSYCGSYLKTIRAGEVISPVFTGGMLEHHREVEEPELSIGGLYFAGSRFPTEDAVKKWAGERGVEGDISKVDDHAFFIAVGDPLLADSVRMVWVAPGVVGEVGVSEKQVATGGGQASMSSPGITTTSIASGGDLFPAQGPSAAAAMVEGVPPIIQGNTDMQDGHQHEFFLTPVPEVGGWRVKSFTSYNNGHAHMIECAIGPAGEIDTRTAPDQTPVGGHAHSHRVVWPFAKSDDRGEDPNFVHKTMGMVDGFCKDILTKAMGPGDFGSKMTEAIDRARAGDQGRGGKNVPFDDSPLDKAAEFKPQLHPRMSRGPKGGQFAKKPGKAPQAPKAQPGSFFESGNMLNTAFSTLASINMRARKGEDISTKDFGFVLTSTDLALDSIDAATGRAGQPIPADIGALRQLAREMGISTMERIGRYLDFVSAVSVYRDEAMSAKRKMGVGPAPGAPKAGVPSDEEVIREWTERARGNTAMDAVEALKITPIIPVGGKAFATRDERNAVAEAYPMKYPEFGAKEKRITQQELDRWGTDEERHDTEEGRRAASARSIARVVDMANKINDPKAALRLGYAMEDENVHDGALVMFNRAALLHAWSLRWAKPPAKEPSPAPAGTSHPKPGFPTQEEEGWSLLASALRETSLPTSRGVPRTASADEFMLMNANDKYFYFKHSDTRNYVLVDRVTGKLVIPSTGEPNLRGVFDRFDIPGYEETPPELA